LRKGVEVTVGPLRLTKWIRLRLDCWTSDDGMNIDWWVDGQMLGSAFDPDPLPPTGTGLLTWGLVVGRTEVLFRDFSVYTLG
jgi:hypothetical protein